MTVAELIKALQEMPQDAEVWSRAEWDAPVLGVHNEGTVQDLATCHDGNFVVLSS